MIRKFGFIGSLVLSLVFLVTVITPATDFAFSRIKLGDVVPDMSLSSLDGNAARYLGSNENQVCVFAFVKPGNPRSIRLIEQWNGLQDKFADKPVHWVLIVSDRHSEGSSAARDSLAPGAEILIDAGDKLYGEYGVALTPTVGVVDPSGILRAYLPFRQINYSATISAHVRFVLGEISSQELEKVLNPPRRVSVTDSISIKTRLKLGKMLLKRNRLESALEHAESILTDFPGLPEGFLLLADIHEASGRSDEAKHARSTAQHMLKSKTDSNSVTIEDTSSIIRTD